MEQLTKEFAKRLVHAALGDHQVISCEKGDTGFFEYVDILAKVKGINDPYNVSILNTDDSPVIQTTASIRINSIVDFINSQRDGK